MKAAVPPPLRSFALTPARLNALDALRFTAAFGVAPLPLRLKLCTEVAGCPERSRCIDFTRHPLWLPRCELIFHDQRFRHSLEFDGPQRRLLCHRTIQSPFSDVLGGPLRDGPPDRDTGLTQQSAVVTWRNLAMNATMLPTLFKAPRIDDVYWTLELELRFYLIVFALLALKQMRRIEHWLSVWLALIVYQRIIGGGRLVGILLLRHSAPTSPPDVSSIWSSAKARPDGES